MEMTDHLYLQAALTLGNVSRILTEHGDRMNFRGNIHSTIPPRTIYLFFVCFICIYSLIIQLTRSINFSNLFLE